MQTTSINTRDLPREIAVPEHRTNSRSRWLRLWAKLRSRAGHFSGRFIRPAIGFGFDLTGSIYRVGGCQFEIPVHLTDRNYRSAFVFGEYEAGERKLIRQYLRTDDRVIELGGCIGVLSCLVSSADVARPFKRRFSKRLQSEQLAETLRSPTLPIRRPADTFCQSGHSLQIKARNRVSPTRFGLAFPLESFITCPFKKLIAATFPAL
jgi:hypothetical protein